MKYTMEFPVIQVAHMSTVNDLEWVLRTVQEGDLFTTIRRDTPMRTFVVSGKDLCCEDDVVKTHSGSGWNPVHVAVRLDDFIVWNQKKEAYAVYWERGGNILPEHMIPEKLQQLILVRV
jgi:hypothetical protein